MSSQLGHTSVNGSLGATLPGVPDEYRCPLSGSIMSDPVRLETGSVFQRAAIASWFLEGHDTCPETGRKLRRSTLEPDAALKTSVNRWLKDQTAAARAAAAQSSARTPTSPRPSPQPDLTSTPVETSTAAAASATAGGVQGISLRDAASSPSGKTAEGGAAGQQTAKPVRSVFANKWETSDGAGAGADSTAVAATDTVPESALAPLPTAPEPVIDAWTETRASGLSPRLPADGAVSSSSVQQQQQQSAEQPRSPSQPVRSIFADKWGSQSHPVPLANAAFGSISAVSSDSFSSAPGRGGLIGVGSVGGGAGGGSEGRKDATDERGEVESRPASPPRLLPRRRLPSPRPVRSIFADKWAGGGTSEPATSTPVTPTASDHGRRSSIDHPAVMPTSAPLDARLPAGPPLEGATEPKSVFAHQWAGAQWADNTASQQRGPVSQQQQHQQPSPDHSRRSSYDPESGVPASFAPPAGSGGGAPVAGLHRASSAGSSSVAPSLQGSDFSVPHSTYSYYSQEQQRNHETSLQVRNQTQQAYSGFSKFADWTPPDHAIAAQRTGPAPNPMSLVDRINAGAVRQPPDLGGYAGLHLQPPAYSAAKAQWQAAQAATPGYQQHPLQQVPQQQQHPVKLDRWGVPISQPFSIHDPNHPQQQQQQQAKQHQQQHQHQHQHQQHQQEEAPNGSHSAVAPGGPHASVPGLAAASGLAAAPASAAPSAALVPRTLPAANGQGPVRLPLKGFSFSLVGYRLSADKTTELAQLMAAVRSLGAEHYRWPVQPGTVTTLLLHPTICQGAFEGNRLEFVAKEFLMKPPIQFFRGLDVLQMSARLQRRPTAREAAACELLPCGVVIITDAATIAAEPAVLKRLFGKMRQAAQNCGRSRTWGIRMSPSELDKLKQAYRRSHQKEVGQALQMFESRLAPKTEVQVAHAAVTGPTFTSNAGAAQALAAVLAPTEISSSHVADPPQLVRDAVKVAYRHMGDCRHVMLASVDAAAVATGSNQSSILAVDGLGGALDLLTSIVEHLEGTLHRRGGEHDM
mmetsp:Transcript_7050/g.20638  ORF Transcript_7050/g.20638 Transcript_7050/m.20638 type:complete len:1030 (+) Transcript_7050:251-3340(+)